MRPIFVFAFIVLNIFTVNAQPLKKELKSIVEKYAEESLLNGVILIAQGNTILYQGAWGYKNFEKKEMNTPATLFPIASLTKQFTTTAILLLQETKKLTINDPIGMYVEVPEKMKAIPIRNLMNHTSGIPDYWQNDIYNQKDSINNFLKQNSRLQFTPDSKHQYCNSGYFLLGEIIEKVSGKSYDDFLSENIFKPLGMKNSFVNNGAEVDRAIGYDEDWHRNDYLMSTADGGLISTLGNLFLWDKALLNNKLLNEESKEQMFEASILNNGEKVNYGFGWDIDEQNKNIVSHTGWLASFGAYNQIDLESRYFLILLSNQIRPELMDLINDINKEMYWSKQ